LQIFKNKHSLFRCIFFRILSIFHACCIRLLANLRTYSTVKFLILREILYIIHFSILPNNSRATFGCFPTMAVRYILNSACPSIVTHNGWLIRNVRVCGYILIIFTSLPIRVALICLYIWITFAILLYGKVNVFLFLILIWRYLWIYTIFFVLILSRVNIVLLTLLISSSSCWLISIHRLTSLL
jgi:hypothetical protein